MHSKSKIHADCFPIYFVHLQIWVWEVLVAALVLCFLSSSVYWVLDVETIFYGPLRTSTSYLHVCLLLWLVLLTCSLKLFEFLLPESGMEHVRVHPRFLHSNATSHKWALGGMVCLPMSYILESIHFSKFCWCMMVLLTCQLSPSCWTTLLMKYAWLKESIVLISSFKFSCAHSVVFLCKVANGATFVNIDMLENKKDGTRMLLVQGVKLSHFA
jgi:hypothetical protein